MLVGAPRDGLHRRGVLGELEHGRGRGGVPHKQVVVVAPGGKLAVVVGPLQAAHLHSARTCPRPSLEPPAPDSTGGKHDGGDSLKMF